MKISYSLVLNWCIFSKLRILRWIWPGHFSYDLNNYHQSGVPDMRGIFGSNNHSQLPCRYSRIYKKYQEWWKQSHCSSQTSMDRQEHTKYAGFNWYLFFFFVKKLDLIDNLYLRQFTIIIDYILLVKFQNSIRKKKLKKL